VRRRVAFAILLGSVGATTAGCDLLEIGPRCPQTLAEAEELTFDDELVAGGYAIRYVPSPNDAAFRGYDVNVTVPISEGAQLNTYFLSVEAPIPGIVDGMPVLLIGDRTDRNFVLVPGACPALTPSTVEEVGP
jgi:hypothetical protein